MRLAILFPGQGSQSVGMFSGFAGNATVSDIMERASAALGEDLVKMAAEGPAELINLTVNTQPLVLAASYAFYEAIRAEGLPEPFVMAGHSLGEYSALTASGALSLERAVPLVRFRASAMQEAVPVGTGGMAAIIGLADETVAAVCAVASSAGVVEPVNFNSPGQVVVAGTRQAVEEASRLCKERGAKRVIGLPVSAPFHSSLLSPARDRLLARLKSEPVAAPSVTVLSNVTAAPHGDPDEIRLSLARQACSPVRWVETMRWLESNGVTHMIECGPGRVLTTLAKRTVPGIACYAVNSTEAMKAALAAIASAN